MTNVLLTIVFLSGFVAGWLVTLANAELALKAKTAVKTFFVNVYNKFKAWRNKE